MLAIPTDQPTVTRGDVAVAQGALVVYGVLIEDNFIEASGYGIQIAGEIAADDLRIDDNYISAQLVGIWFTGVAASPIKIAGNYLQSSHGIHLECEDFDVFDNLILGPSSGAASGIVVEAAPTESWVRGAIERNLIANYVGGIGIGIAADVGRLTIRDNSIRQTDSGIIMSANASADDIVIESNEIVDVGATQHDDAAPERVRRDRAELRIPRGRAGQHALEHRDERDRRRNRSRASPCRSRGSPASSRTRSAGSARSGRPR